MEDWPYLPNLSTYASGNASSDTLLISDGGTNKQLAVHQFVGLWQQASTSSLTGDDQLLLRDDDADNLLKIDLNQIPCAPALSDLAPNNIDFDDDYFIIWDDNSDECKRIRVDAFDAKFGSPYYAGALSCTNVSANSFTVASSDVSKFVQGRAVLLGTAWSNLDRYGIVHAVASNTVTIRGMSLDGADDIVAVGAPGATIVQEFFIGGSFAAGGTTTSLVKDINGQEPYWTRGDAIPVRMVAKCGTADSTSDPTINFRAGTSQAFTSFAVGATSWADDGGTATGTQLDYDETMEVELASAGGSGDAQDLTVYVTMVLIQ
jgi:hypothetical protein